VKRILSVVSMTILCSLATLHTRAAGSDCSSWDGSDAFTYSSVTATKSYFFGELNDRRSQQKAYLVKGDMVAVRNIKSDWACGLYVGSTGVQTIGWLEVKNLKDTTLVQNITGSWTIDSGDAKLMIKKVGTGYGIKGSAIFRSNGNTGEIDGALELRAGQWHYASGGCVLNLLYLNNQLLVQDNLGCGGLNVNFSSAYFRVK
jgi:hypothetical protein